MLKDKIDQWIGEHLSIFQEVTTHPLSVKVTSELGFILLFFEELPNWGTKYLEEMQDKLDFIENIGTYESKLSLLILKNLLKDDLSSVIFTKNEYKFLSYRQQLEITAYRNYQDNLGFDIDINKLFIAKKLKPENYNNLDTYELTHEIMYLSNFGRRKPKDVLEPVSSYLEDTIVYLLDKMLEKGHIDLTGELLVAVKLLEIELPNKLLIASNAAIEKFVDSAVSNQSNSLEDINFIKSYHELLVIRLKEELYNER